MGPPESPLQVPKSVPNCWAQNTAVLLNFSGSDFQIAEKSLLKVPTVYLEKRKENGTGKSLSEALIFASTNPQYDDKFNT